MIARSGGVPGRLQLETATSLRPAWATETGYLKKNAPPSASMHTFTHPSSIFAFLSNLNWGPHNAADAPWLALRLGFFCLSTSFHAACSLKLLSPSLPRPPTKTINMAGSVTPQHQGYSGWNPTWPIRVTETFDYPSSLSQNFLPSVFSLPASSGSLTNSPAVPFASSCGFLSIFSAPLLCLSHRQSSAMWFHLVSWLNSQLYTGDWFVSSLNSKFISLSILGLLSLKTYRFQKRTIGF